MIQNGRVLLGYFEVWSWTGGQPLPGVSVRRVPRLRVAFIARAGWRDRDVNAARNILATGLSAQPPAEESRVAHGS